MLKSLMHVVSETLKSGSHLAVIVAYPYAVPRIKKVLEYLLCLAILKIFNVGSVRVVVDDFDPPVEAAYTFSTQSPSFISTAYNRLLEMLTLKLASYVIALSEFWKQYLARIYHLNETKILVVPNGSLTKRVKYNPPRSEGPITVLYAGSAMKVKDVNRLAQVIARLNEKGLEIRLYVAGAELLNLPQWVHIAQHCWPDFVDNVLVKSDICAIPYPPNRFVFLNAVPAKLFDYMAAGKPVVSTNLREVGNIVKRFECGLIAKDWDEFALHLEKLYNDRTFARKLGENGRKAAEKHFNYELLAEALLTNILHMF
jgi:glycosyltransferase involved in cell wall biosynthesis